MQTGFVRLLLLLVSSLGATCLLRGQANICASADRALADGRLGEAQSLYESCIQSDPSRFETLSNLGIVYTRLGKFTDAVRVYGQALKLNPDNVAVRINLGLAFLKSDKIQEASQEFALAVSSQPENMQAVQLLAFCHFQLGDFEKAIQGAERVLKANPDEAAAAYLLGASYLKTGQYDKAVPSIELAMRKTNSGQSHAILGEAYLGVKAYRRALEEFSKALAIDSSIPGLHGQMGKAYAGLGNTPKAMAEYRQELDNNSTNFDAALSLARLYRLTNSLEEAKEYLLQAEKLRPGNPAVLYEYAVFALSDKDYPQAEKCLQRVLEKLPEFLDAHVLLAEVYFRTRRRDEGLREKAIVKKLRQSQQTTEMAIEKTRSPLAETPMRQASPDQESPDGRPGASR